LDRKFLILAIFWTTVITWLSLVSFLRVPSVSISIPGKDKTVHFIFYFFFVVLWAKGLKVRTKNKQLSILLVAVIYGIIIEVFQGVFTLTRTADALDVVANSIGAISGIVFLRVKKIIV
jgi:VanZ family protein